METTTVAVFASNVSLSFRKHSAVTNVLCDLNLTVNQSSIYALIGPSGCGKTSLLRCLIGFLKPNNGVIKLFGQKISSISSTQLGYMPQQIDLNDDLTINEMLTYFGKLFQIEKCDLKRRITKLTNVLHLSDSNCLIGTLSDGQKRRVCFAATIIHKPDLAILDEPTVGVDPMLREVIWKYMHQLRNKELITFLITTHYVDECKRANVVGFMRNGTIIAEDSPSTLVQKYEVSCLQQIFVKLCEKQELTVGSLKRKDCYEWQTKSEKKMSSWKNEVNIFLVVIGRIFLRVYKKKTFLLLFFVFEIIEFLVFASCYGRTPMHLKVGVVNEDVTLEYSQKFVNQLSSSPLLQLHFYSNFQTAFSEAKKRHIDGLIYFKRYFSESFHNRLTFNFDLNETEINQSQIYYFTDVTNQVISVTISRSLNRAYEKISQQILIENKYPKYALSPIYVDEIISGEISDTDLFGAQKVMSPQMFVYFRYVHSLQISVYSLLKEKGERIYERNFAAGVNGKHVIISHFIVNFFLAGITSLPFLLTSIHAFHIPCEGSLTTVYALILLQIASGVCTGMFLSSLSDSLPLVTIFGVAFQFASLFLSGALWPQQSLPYFVSIFRYLVAFSIPNESVYCVMVKGMSLGNPLVINGFIYSVTYILTLFSLTMITYKF